MDSGDYKPLNVIFVDKDDTDFAKKCESIAESIKSEEISVVNLIEHLGNLLTSESYLQRELGVSVISEVLTKLPSECLNSQQITVIAAYLSGKCKDHHQVVVATLKGILALVQFKNISSDSVISLLNSVFQNVTCQQQQQPDRYRIYEIFEKILQNHLTVVKSLGLDFVYGIISSIDGERDPNNLLYLFDWIRIFLKNVSLGHLSEEMFEVLSCYFPVDFKAPPQDPNRITREALSEALCPCLTAIPEFAEFCLPLALEKLDSSLKIAKIDSLQLLKHGCKNFDVSSYIEHSSEIWSQLQKEILNASDPDIQKECLKTFSAFIQKLATSSDEIYFEKILNDILDTLKGNLLPNSKLFNSSASILISVAAASEKSALLVTKKIGPLLENTFSITNNAQEKIVILNTLIGFFRACAKFHKNADVMNIEELAVIPILCLQSLNNNSSEELRVTAYSRVMDIAEFVSEYVKNSLLELLKMEIVTKQKNRALRDVILGCFKKIATVFPKEIKEKVLYKEEINDLTALDLYLEALSHILELKDFIEIATNILLHYLLINNVQKSSIALKNIQILLSNTSNPIVSKAFIEKQLLQKLIGHVSSCQDDVHDRYDFLTDVSCVLKILIGSQGGGSDIENQSLLVKNEMHNVENNCKKYDSVYVVLLSGLLIRIQKNVVLDYRIVDGLVEMSISGSDSFIKNNAVQLLANLINKMVNETILEEKLAFIKEKCLSNLEEKNSDAITVLSWVTKALLMRNHKEVNVWTEMLINMLENHSEVAQGFRIIMKDSYENLDTLSYCNKMLIYRQKFFVLTTNKIMSLGNAVNVNHLNAIGYLIENAPTQAVTAQFQKILNLVSRCLEKCVEPEVLCVILETIKTFILNEEPIIKNNLEQLLPKILALSTFESSMKVRISVLNCLQELTQHVPIYKLLPFKKTVTQNLALCLDDKKRLVRKEAMEARSLWYLVDAPF